MQRIRGFDGLRALAALTVVLTHLHVYQWGIDAGFVSKAFVNGINGWAGVQLFFSLSGFLITLLLLREFAANGSISLRYFYIRRFLRIVPIYALVVCMVALLQLFLGQVTTVEGLWFAAFYGYNFIPREWYSSVLGHTWSLAVEEHFYVLWPLVLLALYPAISRLRWALVLAILASLSFALSVSRNAWMVDHFFIERWTFVAGAFIASGALLALWIDEPVVQRHLTKPIIPWCALVLVFCDVWFPYDNPYIYAYIRSAGFTLLIAWVYINPQATGVRCLEWRPLRYLGRVSYGIYMYQGLYLATGPAREPGQMWPPPPGAGLLLLCLTVPISYHFFERPIMRLKKRWRAEAISRPGAGP